MVIKLDVRKILQGRPRMVPTRDLFAVAALLVTYLELDLAMFYDLYTVA